jgi:hypothetical protein
MRVGALGAVLVLVLGAASASGRPLKGEGPTALSAAFGSVWVGTGRGELLQLDPRTGTVRKRVAKEYNAIGHVAAVVSAYGAVWISDSGLGIARVDARRPAPPEPVFPAHGALAADGRFLWAADPWRDRILRIDPVRRRVTASARVPGRLVGLSAGGAGAYVVYAPTSGPLTGPRGIRVLRRLDPKTGRVTGAAHSFDCDLSVLVGRAAIWTVDFCTWRLARREPRTLQALVETDSPRTATFATLGFGSVWVSGASRLIRLDPMTLRVQARLWVRGAVAGAGERALWIIDGGFVKQLDPRTNRVVRTFRIRV